jgi:hypothetical protein
MGVCPRFRDFWNKNVTAGAISSCSSLSILGASSSGPLASYPFINVHHTDRRYKFGFM